ncbi:MAG: hypothetical protein KDA78_08170 [Planctomycetaceae bacterium]|nr:hypothetical protein [Planctomycetaceae bacterium]
MKHAAASIRSAVLFSLIFLFTVTVLLFLAGSDIFGFVAVSAILFGLLGFVLVLLTLRLKESHLHRTFFLVTGISAAGIPISVVLHNLVYALGILLFGEGFWAGGTDEPFFFLLAIIVFPILFMIGAVGCLVLLIPPRMMRVIKSENHQNVESS